MEVSKHCSRKREKRKRKGSICSQAIKSTAREETSISYIGKNAGIL